MFPIFLLNIILNVLTQDYFIKLVNCIILTSWTITSYSIVHFLLTPTSRPGFLEAALSKDLLTAAILAGVLAVNFLPLLPFLQSKVVYLVFRFLIILLMPCLVVAPSLYLFLKCLVMEGYVFPCNLLQENIFSEGEKAGFSGGLSTSWTLGAILIYWSKYHDYFTISSKIHKTRFICLHYVSCLVRKSVVIKICRTTFTDKLKHIIW